MDFFIHFKSLENVIRLELFKSLEKSASGFWVNGYQVSETTYSMLFKLIEKRIRAERLVMYVE